MTFGKNRCDRCDRDTLEPTKQTKVVVDDNHYGPATAHTERLSRCSDPNCGYEIWLPDRQGV